MSSTDEQLQASAQRYMTLCNLIEAIWSKRLDHDYSNIDLKNLPAQTSPEARRIALFVEELFTVGSVETGDQTPLPVRHRLTAA